jgi:hypothetical protein
LRLMMTTRAAYDFLFSFFPFYRGTSMRKKAINQAGSCPP